MAECPFPRLKECGHFPFMQIHSFLQFKFRIKRIYIILNYITILNAAYENNVQLGVILWLMTKWGPV